jgi:hypothetical protein
MECQRSPPKKKKNPKTLNPKPKFMNHEELKVPILDVKIHVA